LVRECVCDYERVWLGEEDKRILNDPFITAFERVFTERAIARHIDGQDKKTSPAGEWRVHYRFDDRNGHTNVRHALNLLKYFFRKTRLTGGDLELRRTRDPVNRLIKRVEDRLVRGVHADKDSNAKHDARNREKGPHEMFAEIRVCNEAEKNHGLGPCGRQHQYLLMHVGVCNWKKCCSAC
jgi:hypothetical protein